MTGLTRIVLTGSESVGKTTLGLQLAARYGVTCVPEFVRDYAAAKGVPLDVRDHGPIAEGQMALEDTHIAAALARGDTLLLQDTDLISTVVYCHHYFGHCPEFIEQAAIARRATHYLLLDIDVPCRPSFARRWRDLRRRLPLYGARGSNDSPQPPH